MKKIRLLQDNSFGFTGTLLFWTREDDNNHYGKINLYSNELWDGEAGREYKFPKIKEGKLFEVIEETPCK